MGTGTHHDPFGVVVGGVVADAHHHLQGRRMTFKQGPAVVDAEVKLGGKLFHYFLFEVGFKRGGWRLVVSNADGWWLDLPGRRSDGLMRGE